MGCNRRTADFIDGTVLGRRNAGKGEGDLGKLASRWEEEEEEGRRKPTRARYRPVASTTRWE